MEFINGDIPLERLNREIRARERTGTVWTAYNLLVHLQLRGVLT